MYDLIIIGAGAAGLSAAIYAGRAKLKTLVIEKSEVGGQIKITNEVANYPGVFSAGGKELAAEMKKQALGFGVNFAAGDVAAVDFGGDIKEVRTAAGENYRSVGVIVATGAVPRKLGFEGETEFAGRGIAYCATCDGEFFSGKEVFVIGAGFAAAEEAIFLTRFARKVTVVAREPEFTCSKSIADKVLAHGKIEVKFHTEIVYVRGEKVIQEAKFVNNQTGETWIHRPGNGDSTFGIFVFVGYQPASAVFAGHLETDGAGYILANEDMETKVPGVSAAGDIRPKRLRQLATAVSDGAVASTKIEMYIKEKKEALGIAAEQEVPQEDGFFTEQTAEQIRYVMERCQSRVSLCAVLQDCELSGKIRVFLRDFSEITDRVEVRILQKGEDAGLEAKIATEIYPVIALMDGAGRYTGACFHGVPAGHELESFILAIYNAAGPGQVVGEGLLQRVKKIDKPFNLKIGVSLSCTMCPELVQAGQLMSILNEHISAEMIDLQHFPALRDRYNIMSVPALVINDKDVIFGRKTLEELAGYLESAS
ncbi:MAG: FAD-dependent oxidoreductase [Spirochaetes bacterium]|nr:FAD-dependent oxidoreductase [Spirochaetota bacterium]